MLALDENQGAKWKVIVKRPYEFVKFNGTIKAILSGDKKKTARNWNGGRLEKLHSIGFAVPVEELPFLIHEESFTILSSLVQIGTHFDFPTFVYNYTNVSKTEELQSSLILWQFITRYSKVLSKDYSNYASHLFTDYLDPKQFNSYTEQATFVLLNQLENLVSKDKGVKVVDYSTLNFCAEVVEWSKEVECQLKEKGLIAFEKFIELRTSFYQICERDINKLVLSSYCDPSRNNNLYHPELRLIDRLREDLISKERESFISKFFNLKNSGTNDKKTLSLFLQYKSPFLNFKEDYQDLEERYITSLKSYFSIPNHFFVERFIPFLNRLFAPFIHWESIEGILYPQFNFIQGDESRTIKNKHRKTVGKFLLEEERMKAFIEKYSQLRNEKELKAFREESSFLEFHFKSLGFQDQLRKARKLLQKKMIYREHKKEQFGFNKHKEMLSNQELFLDEMLKIEQEVKLYVSFVNDAFHKALPSVKRAFFDGNRHIIDGGEIDPGAFLDPQKWYRAEVTKSMKIKNVTKEIEQVNTFCLDFSGSMNHDRMRNLYKLLFLFIQGLEGYRSFNAIHFFNQMFKEGLSFEESYTDRSLLYGILRKISTIENGSLVYGGKGGTNISDALLKSHILSENFISKIKAKFPEKEIVSTIFLITDGQPTVGIIKTENLRELVMNLQNQSGVSIKAAFISPEGSDHGFVEQIFGEGNYVETHNFDEGVKKIVSILVQTFKKQRKEYKWKLRKQKQQNN